jgi:hypothetical protein
MGGVPLSYGTSTMRNMFFYCNCCSSSLWICGTISFTNGLNVFFAFIVSTETGELWQILLGQTCHLSAIILCDVTGLSARVPQERGAWSLAFYSADGKTQNCCVFHGIYEVKWSAIIHHCTICVFQCISYRRANRYSTIGYMFILCTTGCIDI